MKKITRVLVFLFLALSLAACGGADSEKDNQKPETAHVKKEEPLTPSANRGTTASPSGRSSKIDPNAAKRESYSGYWTSTGDPLHSITIRPDRILYNEGIDKYGQVAWSNKLTAKGNQIIIQNAPLTGAGGQAAGFVTQTMTLSKDKKTLIVSKNKAFGSSKEKGTAWAQYYMRFNKHYSGTFKKVESPNSKSASAGTPSSSENSTAASNKNAGSGYNGIWSNTNKTFNEYYKHQFTDHGPTEPIQNVTIEMPIYNVVKISIENVLGNRQAPATMKHTVAIDLKGRGQFRFVDSFHNKGGIAKFQLKDNKVYYEIHYSIKPQNSSISEGAHVLSLKKGV
ncbi:hypothetical protein NIE88_15295 [Sporolactobacillus shoreicorticis]|uniref:Lipoprotein n=1 Tax=Sporolactobacillus shoreicorticis TaxID=1923877 RepID=A0ABW5S4F3_9BACL|nr:hypothetical protein [Sporolactobacillus shoreicorticis]MCO7127135.1 hypothetical protein [Sporolactobacillus shoreicorticis]